MLKHLQISLSYIILFSSDIKFKRLKEGSSRKYFEHQEFLYRDASEPLLFPKEKVSCPENGLQRINC